MKIANVKFFSEHCEVISCSSVMSCKSLCDFKNEKVTNTRFTGANISLGVMLLRSD